MKKKGMRFQTRLMLTMLSVVVGVMIALTAASERKIRDAYVSQFRREFQKLTDRLEESRTDRSREFLELSTELASHPYISASLQGDATREQEIDFWTGYARSFQELDSVRSQGSQSARPQLPQGGPFRRGGSGGGGGGGDMISRLSVIAIVKPDGDGERLFPPMQEQARKALEKRSPFRGAEKREVLESLMEAGRQQTVYLPMPGRNGNTAVQEMVATPVTDPETGELLGLFLRGTVAETEAQRFLDRYSEEFGDGDTVRSGIFVDGEFYTRTEDEAFVEAMNGVLLRFLAEAYENGTTANFETEIAGKAYSLHLDRLTEPTVRPIAVQVAAFPLDRMKADLQELRISGSGIGLGVVLIGWLASFLLARKLSVPLHELARGTEAIRAGQLDHRVDVRSRDELGELAESFNEMAEELKQKALYRELLGKVSDESVAHALVSGTLDLELGGETRNASILFCDIRGFTGLTETMHPDEVIAFLNDHMTAMTAIVRRHYGVVDKFVGDEIMAVFGAPKSYGQDAVNAAACAAEMLAVREQLNREHLASSGGNGLPPIEIGIGIASGEVVAGCMGSEDRLNYTVLGARVNLAARLCSAAGLGEAVIDEETAASLPSTDGLDELVGLELKGFRQAVRAYRMRPGFQLEAPVLSNGSAGEAEADPAPKLTPPQTATPGGSRES